MKKIVFSAGFVFITCLVFGQISSKEYHDLLSNARSLYNAKEYKNAAVAHSSAMRAAGPLVTNGQRYSSACYWSLAGFSDSACLQLDIIAASANLNFEFILELVTDEDFLPLHKEVRWKELKRKLLKMAGHEADELVNAIDFVRANNYDSAFYYLNIAAGSKDLTFECAGYMIINQYFFTALEKEKLKNDRRWPELKDKVFTTLNKNYIPASAFINTIKSPKRLLIDGGHYNGHNINGTYATLAGTLRKSGFEVSGLERKFDEASLENIDLLLIANPQPDRSDSLFQRARRANEPLGEFLRWSATYTQSAYTEAEASVIENWVKNGGSLLLILDHAPHGKNGALLTAAFGIENRNVGTYDTLSLDPISDTADGARNILFKRSKGLIGKHSIVQGMDSVTTYTGESLIGPPGSDVLLHLPSTAYDKDWLPETKQFRYRSAAGRSQALAFDYGKGRVVMLGEAAITRPEFLSVSNRGNWKFILNILRWLAREKMD